MGVASGRHRLASRQATSLKAQQTCSRAKLSCLARASSLACASKQISAALALSSGDRSHLLSEIDLGGCGLRVLVVRPFVVTALRTKVRLLWGAVWSAVLGAVWSAVWSVITREKTHEQGRISHGRCSLQVRLPHPGGAAQASCVPFWCAIDADRSRAIVKMIVDQQAELPAPSQAIVS